MEIIAGIAAHDGTEGVRLVSRAARERSFHHRERVSSASALAAQDLAATGGLHPRPESLLP